MNRYEPVWIFVDLPEEKEARSKIRMNQLKEGLVHTRTAAYLPYKDNVQRVAKLGFSAKQLEEQTRYKPESSEDSIRYYPLTARYSAGLLGIDTRDGSVVELLEKKEALESVEPGEEEVREDEKPEDEAS